MAVRIFISHSTGEKPGYKLIAEHVEFRQKVYERLKAEVGFDVQIDKDIPAGTYWRDLLFGRLDECNAAVVLVDERALSHSNWVDFEVKILGWRAWIERKDFRLIMIPFGGVTRLQIAQHPAWEAITLSEVQMIPSGESGLDISDQAVVTDTLDKVVEALRSLPDQPADESVSSWLVGSLACFLKLEKKPLENIADELKVSKCLNLNLLRKRIALQLYEAGPKSLNTLLEARDVNIPGDDLRMVLEILSTNWIDPSASATILKFRRVSVPKAVFAINGSFEYFTPEAYIRQICCLRKPWPVIVVDGKQSQADILEQIRADLKSKFSNNLQKSRTTEDQVDQRINELLKLRLEQLEAPVFVALSPVAAKDHALIEAIRDTYKDLRIILCTGGSESLPDIEMLRPELDPQRETIAYEEYYATLSLLP